MGRTYVYKIRILWCDPATSLDQPLKASLLYFTYEPTDKRNWFELTAVILLFMFYGGDKYVCMQKIWKSHPSESLLFTSRRKRISTHTQQAFFPCTAYVCMDVRSMLPSPVGERSILTDKYICFIILHYRHTIPTYLLAAHIALLLLDTSIGKRKALSAASTRLYHNFYHYMHLTILYSTVGAVS